MNKTYNISVDCINCANTMEDIANNTPGVMDASVSFMTQRLEVEFEDGRFATYSFKQLEELELAYAIGAGRLSRTVRLNFNKSGTGAGFG